MRRAFALVDELVDALRKRAEKRVDELVGERKFRMRERSQLHMTKTPYYGKGKSAMMDAYHTKEKTRDAQLTEIFKNTYGVSETTSENKLAIPLDVRMMILVCVLRWYDALHNLEYGEFHPTIESAMNDTETFFQAISNYKLLKKYCPGVATYYDCYCIEYEGAQAVINTPNKKSSMLYALAIHHTFKHVVVDLFVDVESKKLTNKYFNEVFAGCFLDRDENDENVKRLRADIARLLKTWMEDNESKKQKEELAIACFGIVEKAAAKEEIEEMREVRTNELYKAETMLGKKKRPFAEDAISTILLFEKDGVKKKCRYDVEEVDDASDE